MGAAVTASGVTGGARVVWSLVGSPYRRSRMPARNLRKAARSPGADGNLAPLRRSVSRWRRKPGLAPFAQSASVIVPESLITLTPVGVINPPADFTDPLRTRSRLTAGAHRLRRPPRPLDPAPPPVHAKSDRA